MSSPYGKRMLLRGVEELQKKKSPFNLIVSGRHVAELDNYNNVHYYPSFSQKMEGAWCVMGSRGSFLESGGFGTPSRWHTVDYVDGIKVLAPKDPRVSISLPERSNTPGTAYMSYRKDGTFDQYIVFGSNRLPVYRIDYGVHRNKKSLHVHFYKD